MLKSFLHYSSFIGLLLNHTQATLQVLIVQTFLYTYPKDIYSGNMIIKLRKKFTSSFISLLLFVVFVFSLIHF